MLPGSQDMPSKCQHAAEGDLGTSLESLFSGGSSDSGCVPVSLSLQTKHVAAFSRRHAGGLGSARCEMEEATQRLAFYAKVLFLGSNKEILINFLAKLQKI